LKLFPEGRIIRLLVITSELETDWRAIMAGIFIPFVVVFVCFDLFDHFSKASQPSNSPAPSVNRPPMAPYWIPFIGKAISHLIDGAIAVD